MFAFYGVSEKKSFLTGKETLRHPRPLIFIWTVPKLYDMKSKVENDSENE